MRWSQPQRVAGDSGGGGSGGSGGSGGDPYIFYSIQLPQDLPTGTVITIQASLAYGTDAPISLPAITYTIDNTPPTSSVNALPAESSDPFQLSWSGQASEGVGIASYNVWVSDNGGAYTPLVTDTTQTSTVFTGQPGHTYSFYTVATDNVGNVQPTPASAQATTTVVSPLSLTSIGPFRRTRGTLRTQPSM